MAQTQSKRILIFEADDGWEPSRELVRSVLVQMAAKGLRTDWDFCVATKYHDLIFCDGDTDPAAIEARKHGRTWELFTDSGQKL